jgi:zinc transporter ZupT
MFQKRSTPLVTVNPCGSEHYFTVQLAISIRTDMVQEEVGLWDVGYYSFAGAVACALGAAPFLFFSLQTLSPEFVGICYAIATGAMSAAVLGLLEEGSRDNVPATLAGILVGVLFVWLCSHLVDQRSPSASDKQIKKSFMVMLIMSLHSLAEGVGVGVSFCGKHGAKTGKFISIAIGLHNIPEGLAIALVMIPQRKTVLTTAWLCFLSSVPQPLAAVPAFLFVRYFEVFQPFGFGTAAGAMLWLVVVEIFPEASRVLNHFQIAVFVFLSMSCMFIIQNYY